MAGDGVSEGKEIVLATLSLHVEVWQVDRGGYTAWAARVVGNEQEFIHQTPERAVQLAVAQFDIRHHVVIQAPAELDKARRRG